MPGFASQQLAISDCGCDICVYIAILSMLVSPANKTHLKISFTRQNRLKCNSNTSNIAVITNKIKARIAQPVAGEFFKISKPNRISSAGQCRPPSLP